MAAEEVVVVEVAAARRGDVREGASVVVCGEMEVSAFVRCGWGVMCECVGRDA